MSRMISSFVISATIGLGILFCGSAKAESVMVRSGSANGQGFAFLVPGQGCFVVSVAHVILDESADLTVHGQTGAIFDAEVLRIDRDLDLVLLDIGISEERIKYRYDQPDLCETSIQYRYEGIALSNPETTFTWLDKVASPAGGLVRLMIGDTVDAQANKIEIPLQDSSVSISQGDSGAPIAAVRYSASRYSLEENRRVVAGALFSDEPENSTPRERGVNGYFIGLLQSIDNENKLNIIPAHKVLDFALDGIADVPYSIADIDLKTKYGDVVARFRGSARQRRFMNGRTQYSTLFVGTEFNAYSWIIDMGPRDRRPAKVTLTYNKDPNDMDFSDASTNNYELPIGIYTSNRAPQNVETMNDIALSASALELMDPVKCEPTENTNKQYYSFADTVSAASNKYILECAFIDQKITRTLAITAFAEPGSLESVAVDFRD